MVSKKYPYCRSETLHIFVKQTKEKFKKKGLNPPTTEKIVRYLIRKTDVKPDDVLKDEFIRF